jgi:hypothetical protein
VRRRQPAPARALACSDGARTRWLVSTDVKALIFPHREVRRAPLGRAKLEGDPARREDRVPDGDGELAGQARAAWRGACRLGARGVELPHDTAGESHLWGTRGRPDRNLGAGGVARLDVDYDRPCLMARRRTTRASSGLGEAAEAIRERVGLGARYSSFVPPRVRDAPRPRRRRWSRVLWAALLLNLLVILVLAVLVGLGL